MEKRKAVIFVAIAVALLVSAMSMGCVDKAKEEEEVIKEDLKQAGEVIKEDLEKVKVGPEHVGEVIKEDLKQAGEVIKEDLEKVKEEL